MAVKYRERGITYRGTGRKGGASTPFTPNSIPNNVLWLDASDTSTISQTGGSVSQWNDKSGNGNNATQGTGANQPITGTRTVNGLNVLDFDGTNDFLNLPSGVFGLSSGDNTIFLVFATDVIMTAQRLWLMTDSGSGRHTLQWGGDSTFSTAASNSNVVVSSMGITPNMSPHIAGLFRSGGNFYSFFDGVQGPSTAATNFTANQAYLATFRGTSTFLNGVICEVIAYNRALTPAEVNQVGNYLSVKWGPTWTSFPVGSLVAFGDSVTAGFAASTVNNRWTNLLASQLNYSLLNQGASGTVLQNSNNSGGTPFPNNGRDRYVADLTGVNKRDRVYILYGLNDLRYTAAPATMNLANYINDYQEIITGLLGAGYTVNDIYLGSPPYITTAGYSTGSAGFTGSNATIHQAYVDAVRQLAVTNNVYYSDVYQAMKNNGGDSLIDADQIHPNDAGMQVIYQSFLSASKVV